ncbi:MAG: CAP domain-containing protein [Cyanobacteria bacterium P01_A01_bin.40]
MSSQLINQVLELTNAERAKAGLNPLTLNNQLAQAAQGHSDRMAEDDFFSHTGADGSSVSDRVQDTGYQYSRAGENIAAGQRTAEQVVQDWMNSPGHRANILNPEFTEIGIGYELLENDTGSVNYNHYWTQVFGTPLNNSNSTGSNNQPEPALEPNDTPAVENNIDSLAEPESGDSSTIESPELGDQNTFDSNSSEPVEEPEIIPEVIETTNNEATPADALNDNSGALENIPEETGDSSEMDNLEPDLFGGSNDYSMEQEGNYDQDYLIDQLGNSIMTGGADAVNFTDNSESSSNSQFTFSSSYSLGNIIELVENSGVGNTGFDSSNYESMIMDHFSNFDLDPQHQQQIMETLESLF